MKNILILLLLVCSCMVYGQVNTPWTQYSQVPYLQNAAFSGLERGTDVKLGFRRQWTSFDGAPKDYFLGVNHALGQNASDSAAQTQSLTTGVSGYLSGSDYNAINSLQFGVAYAVHVPVAERYKLSFGMAANYNRSKVSLDELIARDKADPVYVSLVNAGGSLRYFTLDAGFLLHADHVYIGYSAGRLVRSRLGGDVPGDATSSIRHTFQAGYRYAVNADWDLLPAVLVRLENGLENLYAVNLKARYKGMVWGGLGFRYNTSVSLFAGYQCKNSLTISYGYDVNLGSLGTASPGSHEVVLGFRPFRKGSAPTAGW